jgi:RNA polymerase sigma-70 factor, ECF subfamily
MARRTSGGAGTDATDGAARLTRLFEEHHGTVLAYATRRVGPHAAADVAAETFAVATRRVHELPSGGELPWLLATARNVLLASARADARRTDRETRAHDRSHPTVAAEPDHAGRAAELDVVLRALGRLGEPDRELLLLVAWDGLPLNQAAIVLGCSAGAVRVRWLRARRRFADALGAVDGEPPRVAHEARVRPRSVEPSLGGTP